MGAGLGRANKNSRRPSSAVWSCSGYYLWSALPSDCRWCIYYPPSPRPAPADSGSQSRWGGSGRKGWPLSRTAHSAESRILRNKRGLWVQSIVHCLECPTWVCEQMDLIKDINMYACSRVYWRQVPGPIKAAHVRAWNIKIRLVTIRRCQEVLNKSSDWITGITPDTHRCQCRPCGGSGDEIRTDF